MSLTIFAKYKNFLTWNVRNPIGFEELLFDPLILCQVCVLIEMFESIFIQKENKLLIFLFKIIGSFRKYITREPFVELN